MFSYNGQTHTIGVLIEDIRCTPAPEILNGIAETLEKENYQMLVHDLHLYEKIQNQYDQLVNYTDHIDSGFKLLRQSMVGGIIYISMHMRQLHIKFPSDIPLIFSYACCSTPNSYVMYDDISSASQMTQYLIDLGHREIALISGPSSSYAAQKRLQGFLQTLAHNQLEISTSYIKTGDWEYDSGYKKCLELLHSPRRPSAIFVMNDIMAAGAYKACYERHLQIPQDITIVGFDNREISRYLQPPLTTMNLPLKEIGQQSAAILLSKLEEKSQPLKHIVIPCEIIKRDSSARIN